MKTKVAVLAALAALIAVPTSSAAIRITKIYYDSPGSDDGSKSSLNAEWIRLKNTGTKGRYLTGWTIRDTSSHVYRFGSFKLRAGYSVTVHTGSGSNTASHRYWGSGWYIWNNTGDTATLKSARGTVLDTCKWTSGGAGYKNC